MRVRYVERTTQISNRVQKVLEDAQIKLGNVISDVLGVSGRAMRKAMLEGQADAQQLARLARGRMRSKQAQLEQSLTGDFTAHHRFQIELLLEDLDQTE